MNKYRIAILLLATLLLAQGVSMSAQEQKEFSRFEVSAATGLVMTGGPKSGAEPSSFPLVYDLSFRYYPKAWLSVGMSAGNDMYVYWGADFFVVLTPSVNFHWLRRRSFSAYSGIGYSIPLQGERLKNWSEGWYEGFQYTPIGITFGRSLYGLAELGFGPRYFPLRLGIGYRF